jgi:hypothetical protein
MEDDLNFLKMQDKISFVFENGRGHQFLKMKDNRNFLKIEGDLNFLKMEEHINVLKWKTK